jgi:hypothetical protein
LPQDYSRSTKHPEKWTLEHFVSFAQQRSCASVVGGQREHCRASTTVSGLVRAQVFPVSAAKCGLREQQFARAEEVTAKAIRALAKVSKNGFQESFHKLYDLANGRLSKGTTFKEIVCK